MTADTTPIIRPYRPEDRRAVREICCDTAYRNRGAEFLFEDREIHADYWSYYYTDVTPEETWVAEVDGTVVAYFFGCPDTPRFRRYMATRIVPWCLVRAFWRLASGQYKSAKTKRYLWFMLTRAPREEAPCDIARYPAHYHCNVIEDGRNHRLYSKMARAYIDRLEHQGIDGVHGFITEPAKKGIWDLFDRQFNKGGGLDPVERSEKPTEAQAYILGDPTPMVNRSWATRTPTFRAFLDFLEQRMNI